jgi:hypothetical protein
MALRLSLLLPLVPLAASFAGEPDLRLLGIVIRAPQTTVKAGAPLIVRVTWRNNQTTEVFIAQAGEPMRFPAHDFVVRDARGALVPLTPYGQEAYSAVQFYGSRGIGHPVPPGGESKADEYDVTKFFDLKPGTYTIQATWGRGNVKDPPISNTITVTVTP